MKLNLFLMLGMAVAMTASVAAENKKDSMSFRIDRPCDGNGSMCAQSIYATGSIERDTAKKFREFYSRARSDKNNYLPDSPTVIFLSPGGSVLGGIELGEAIRSLGLDTYLPNDSFCASACALAFIGGIERRFDPESKFGVHQFSSAGNSGSESDAQVTVVLLADYIEKMGVTRVLLDIASLVPPSEMYWITDEARKELRVDNTEPLIEGWKLDTTKDGKTFAIAKAMFSGDKPIAEYAVTKSDESMYLFVRMVVPDKDKNRLSQFVYAMNDKDGRIDFNFGDNNSIQSNKFSWEYTDGIGYGVVEMPWSVFGMIRRYEQVEIDFNVPRYLSDIDPSVSLSAKELNRFYPALIK